MDSLASIIVPCYNGEKFVDRCFDSILKQKYAHMEVIVVNDGSTDQSEQRVLAWNDRFRNAGIQLVYVSQENKGPGGAINTGLKHVTGESVTDYIKLRFILAILVQTGIVSYNDIPDYTAGGGSLPIVLNDMNGKVDLQSSEIYQSLLSRTASA